MTAASDYLTKLSSIASKGAERAARDVELGRNALGHGPMSPQDQVDYDNQKKKVALVIFRNDLRVHDNASLYHAHADHKDAGITHVQPVYIFDERFIELSGLPDYQRKGGEARTRLCGFWRTGVHRARFLSESVFDLRDRLRDRGSDLMIRFGRTEEAIVNIVKAIQAEPKTELIAIHAQKEACSEETDQEKGISESLPSLGLSEAILYMHDTKTWLCKSAMPFTKDTLPDVFTPFRKKIEALGERMSRKLLDLPDRFLPTLRNRDDEEITDDRFGNYGRNLMRKITLDTLLEYVLEPLRGTYEMKYAQPNSAKHKSSAFPWRGGESSALDRVEWYFTTGEPPPVSRYKFTRNMLVGHAYSTKMSPFLCLGCISPRLVSKALEEHEEKFGSTQNTYWVRFEMLWRDYFLLISEKYGDRLFYLKGFEGQTDPKMAEKRAKEWKWFNGGDSYLLQSWLRGRTGIPFIDANIIELRETGFMSNRGRQNVASFLTKDLYFDWRIGAEFFESHLIDYDPTANYGNWQYVAGTGNDPRASRQFNPIKQARDYDPTGEYVRTWIPQLKDLPISRIHTPWLMSDADWDKFCPDNARFKRAVADSMSSHASATASLSSAKNRLAPLNKDNMDAQAIAAKSIGLRPPTSPLKRLSVTDPSGSMRKESYSGSSNDDVTPSVNPTLRSLRPTDAGSASDGSGNTGDNRHMRIPHDYFSSHSSSSTNSHSENDAEEDEGQSSASSNVRSSFQSSNNSDKATGSASTTQSSPGADEGTAGQHHGHKQRTETQATERSKRELDVRTRDTQQIMNAKNLSTVDPKAAIAHQGDTIASDDYSAGMPYPRKPLFEQQSWKAHYFRKDLGRKKGGAGGGDSRRLVRPPKAQAPK